MNHDVDVAAEKIPLFPYVMGAQEDIHHVLSASKYATDESYSTLAALQRQALQAVVGLSPPHQGVGNALPSTVKSSAGASKNTKLTKSKITSSKADALLQMRIYLERQHDRQELHQQQEDMHDAASPLPVIKQPVMLQGKGMQMVPSSPSKQR
jgi:hypothetical protein